MSKKRKQRKNQIKEEPQLMRNWIAMVTEDQPKLAVPVGPQFQADVPHYGSPGRGDNTLCTEKWLGERTWSVQDKSSVSREGNKKRTRKVNSSKGIGEGRPEICSCRFPGSVKCIEYHVREERMKFKTELGPVYEIWKFDEMGDVVSKSWNKEDQQTFKFLVKQNPISQGDGFMKPALKYWSSKDRANIVSYYLNVYLPRRISKQTRSRSTTIDTDEEDESDGERTSTSSSRDKARGKLEIKSKKSRTYLSGCR